MTSLRDESAEVPFDTSDRGFRYYESIPSAYGHKIDVYESSAASGPHIWLAIDGDEALIEDKAHVHLTVEQAQRLRDTLDAAIVNHYQLR